MSQQYQISGLCVRSPFELAGVPPSPAGLQTDVEVRFGTVPDRLESAFQAATYQVTADELLLSIPSVGRYWVRSGREIVIERADGADDHDLRVFMLGSCLGAICHQRGLLPLHASAVRWGDGCIAFAGPSGAGKSTFAAFLAARGHALLADDVCVVSRAAEGGLLVAPGFPQVKLWRDGVEQLQADSDGLTRVRRKADKYYIPVPVGFESRPARPLRIYLVEEPTAQAPAESLRGLDAVRGIAAHTYRYEFVSAMGRDRDHFALCAALAAQAEVVRLPRPGDFADLERTLAALEADWRMAS